MKKFLGVLLMGFILGLFLIVTAEWKIISAFHSTELTCFVSQDNLNVDIFMTLNVSPTQMLSSEKCVEPTMEVFLLSTGRVSLQSSGEALLLLNKEYDIALSWYRIDNRNNTTTLQGQESKNNQSIMRECRLDIGEFLIYF